MLGNTGEAEKELKLLRPDLRDRPDVMDLAWEIHARNKAWPKALRAASQIAKRTPESANGWIKTAFTLHELKRTQKAWDTLQKIRPRFPEIGLIPYNLACYACQLGKRVEVLEMLVRAVAIDDKRSIREQALNDPDLAPMKSEIAALLG